MMRTIFILTIVSLLLMSCTKSTEPKYTISAPTFSPAGGSYSSVQTVSIYCNVSNAQIRYTLDGSDPGSNSPIYSVPIQISRNSELKARAYKSKMKPSAITSKTFTFSVGTVYITPIGGTFSTPQTVTFVTTNLLTQIHYTTDGTEPTTESPLYSGAMQLDGNTVLKAKGFIEGWSPSNTTTANFVFQPELPVLNYGTGVYFSELSLTMSSTTPNATIHYTTNDSEPTETSPVYSSPINVQQNTIVKAKAYKANWTPSLTTVADFSLRPAAPTFNPAANTFSAPQKVSIACNTPEASIYYTTDGSEPSNSSSLYSAPVYLTQNTSLKAKAYRTGWSPGATNVANYNFVVAAPAFNPPQGEYFETQNVAITCATPGAEIRYTTNNTTPTPVSPLYTAPIVVSSTTMLKATAFKTNMITSPTVASLYTFISVVSTPTFDPPAGIYYQPQTVTISCATPNAEIHYTIDNTEPNSSSPIYQDALTVNASTTIRAKAYKSNWNPSSTAEAAYSIESAEQIAAWGFNEYNQCNIPLGNDFAKIDAGLFHSLGLRTDGSLVAWGGNNAGQCNYPAGNDYVAVSAGDLHSLALKADGTIVAWGSNTDGQCDVPDSLGYTFVAIAAGGNHSVAITSDSMLVAWGNNDDGQCDVPTGNNFIKISAGENHTIALRDNNTIVAWGNNDNGQINAPTGANFVDVAAGSQHCIAKRTTGVLVGWGNNEFQQTICPAGADFIQISAGYRHNLALRQNGTIVTWGYNGEGLTNVPASNSFIQVSAGGDFSTGLKSITRKRITPKQTNTKWKYKK